MPEREPEPYESCAVCGRTLLRGERVVEYTAPDGQIEPVCTLCRSRAEDLGWVRSDQATARFGADPPRRRRLPALNLRLRDRAARLAERARSPAPEQADPEPPQLEKPEPEPPPPPPPPDTPERRIRRGIERFNDSETPRVVAGLTKSLGPPQASVRDLPNPPRVQVTVAWDLSWYRWDVGLNGEEAPEEVAKGAEVDELAGDGLEWNASVDEQGRLRWPESS